MPIHLLSPADITRMRAAGRAAAATLAHIATRLRPGLSTAGIDRLVRADTRARGGRPSQLGYHGFPAAVCTSINQVVCHGIPRPDVVLAPGDIINVDITTELDGFHGDTSQTFLIPGPAPASKTPAQHLIAAVNEGLQAGIAAVRPGARLGDIGAAIEAVARRHGCSVVEEYGGHGIGRAMHLPPHIHHTGTAGRGLRLEPGMAFTIEPMFNLGGAAVRLLDDGWTVVTADGALSAQAEHTVLVTRQGVEVLTAREHVT